MSDLLALVRSSERLPPLRFQCLLALAAASDGEGVSPAWGLPFGDLALGSILEEFVLLALDEFF
jgi:hypothetical protein